MTPRLDVIGFVASDLAATLAFYRRLGLAIPLGAEDAPHVELKLPGGMSLMWDTVEVQRSFNPGWQPPTGGPNASLAFACDSPAEVDAVHADLVGAGYRSGHEPWDAEWGQRYAVVLDPDGNGVDLYAPL